MPVMPSQMSYKVTSLQQFLKIGSNEGLASKTSLLNENSFTFQRNICCALFIHLTYNSGCVFQKVQEPKYEILYFHYKGKVF